MPKVGRDVEKFQVNRMEKRKTDKRTIFTKKLIKNNLKKMVCQMNYEEITIKELTANAGINRKTFYLHYTSLDGLFKEVSDEVVMEFENIYLQQEQDSSDHINYSNIINNFKKLIKQDQKFHQQLFCNESYLHIFTYICNQATDFFKNRVKDDNAHLNIDVDITISFLVSGLFTVFRDYYLMNDNQDYQDHADKIISQLFQIGIQNLS